MKLKHAALLMGLVGLGILLLTCVLPLRIRDDYEHDWRKQTVEGVVITAGAYPKDIDTTSKGLPWPHHSMWGNPYSVEVGVIFNARKDIVSIVVDRVIVNSTFDLKEKARDGPITHGDRVRATWEAFFGSVPSSLPYEDWDLRIQMTWHLKNGDALKKETDLALPLEHRTRFRNDLVDGLLSE